LRRSYAVFDILNQHKSLNFHPRGSITFTKNFIWERGAVGTRPQTKRAVEQFTLENMGIAFGILSLGCTEPEIHLGVFYPPPPFAMYILKNTIATLGLK